MAGHSVTSSFSRLLSVSPTNGQGPLIQERWAVKAVRTLQRNERVDLRLLVLGGWEGGRIAGCKISDRARL
jgi:hypothetical protein